MESKRKEIKKNSSNTLLANKVKSVITLIFLLLSSTSAFSTTYYSRATGNWNANGTWSTVGFTSATNTGTFPVAGDVVNIGGGFTVTVNVASACASITYEAAGRSNTLTISSGIALTVSGTITIPRATGGGTSNINLLAVGAGNLTAATLAYTSSGNSTRHRLTISTGTVTITGNITTSTTGASALVSFTGAGTLNVGGSMFSGGGGTFTASTSTVNYNGSGAQTIATFTYYNLTVTGNSTKSLRAATNVSNILTVNAGATLSLATFTLGATTRPTSTVLFCGAVTGSTISGTGVFSLGGNVTVTSAGTGTSGATISCPVSLIASRTFTVADDGSTAKDLSMSGIVSGATFGVTKLGAGTMELSALNTYTGTTTVSAGTLRASNNTVVASTNGPFGNNASGLSLAGGTIESNVATFSRPVTVTVTNSRLDAYGAARTITSAINLATAGIFNLFIGGTTVASAEGQVLTLSSVISNSAGTLNITKTGTSTATFSGASTYTGTTTVSGGTLIAGAAVAVSTNGPFGNSASTLTLGDAATTTNNSSPSLLTGGAFTIARTITIANQASSGTYSIGGNAASTSLFSGTITLNQPLSITQIAAGTVQLSGTVTTGTNKVTKIGAGTFQRTSAALSLGGAFEVNAGTFDANAFATTVSGLTTVSGGTYTASTAAQSLNGGLTISGGTYTGLSGTAGNTVTTNLTLSSGTLSAPGSTGTFSISGNWSYGGGTFTTNSGTATFNGTTQSIGGGSSTTFNTLSIAGTSTTTLSINTAISANLTVSGTLDLSTFSCNRGGAGGTLTVSGTIKLGGTSGGQTGSNFPTNFSTLTLAGSTVNYYRTSGGQTVYSTPTYITLTLSNPSGTQTAGGNLACTTLNTSFGGTLDMVTNTLSVTGTPSNLGTISTQNTSATPISTGKAWGGTVNYSAGANQTVVSATSYTNLILSNSGNKTFAAATSIVANISISGTAKAALATFTSSANTLTLGGTPQTNGSWGSTASAATNKNNTWFLSPNTGIINIAVAGCTNSSAAVLSGTASICSGNSTNLSVSITGGTSPFSVVYTDGITPVTVNSYTSGSAIPVSPASTKTFSLVSVTGTGGCIGTGLSGTALVTVNNGATAAVLSGAATICTGGSTNLSVAITGGTSPFTVVYTDGITPVSVSGYTSGTAISVAPTTTKTYSLVSVTATGGCAGSGLSGTPLVTVNQLPTANAGGNTTVCGSNSYTFSSATASNNSSVTWSSVGDGSFNNPALLATTYNFGPNDLLVGSVSITLTANGNSPCGNTSNTILLTHNLNGTWLGTVNTDWATAGNWCGGIPSSTTAVIIPDGAPNYPIISSGAQAAQSISIEPASSLQINGGTLSLNGDIVVDGSITVGSAGTLDMVSNQINGSGTMQINGVFKTSKAAGFSGTASTAVNSTIGVLSLGASSQVDYTSGGSQQITAGNYAHLNNSGNGDRILANTGSIGVSGLFTPGAGDYTVTGSTVEFNGTSAQTIPALGLNSIYNSIEINNAAGVSMVADLNLESSLTLTNGDFTTTGFIFTFLSSATKTARIAPITGGNIVGDVTVQRFVPGGNAGWSTIGMPVAGKTIDEWIDDIVTSGFTGSTTGTGTFVSIYSYDESATGNSDATASYVPVGSSTDAVDPVKGYFAFIADNATTVTDKILDVTGPPLTDIQDLNVSYTANTNVNEDGWNLVSNPYVSAIDWTSPNWTKVNMDNAIYIYDADNAQYVGYVSGASFNGGNEIIGSSQSFFVHANAAAPSLVASEDVKDISSPTFYRMSSSATDGLLRLQLDGLNGTYHDETVFRTIAGASQNFDAAFDAYKLYSFDYSAPNICSISNGIKYVVNSVSDLTGNFDLPVKVNIPTPGDYTINFKGLQHYSTLGCFTFEDTETNTFVDLSVDSSYTYVSAIDTVSAHVRFVLHFGVEAIVPVILPSATNVSLPGNANIAFSNGSTGATSYTWDFGDGSALDTSFSPSHTYTASGIYPVVLVARNSADCSQSTNVNITVDDVTSVVEEFDLESIHLSQNGQEINLTYNFEKSTSLEISFFNALGEQVGSKKIEEVQQSGKLQLEAPKVAKGVYTVEVIFGEKKIAKTLSF